MKKASLAPQHQLFLLSLVAFLSSVTTISTLAAERPNIIVIMADDK